MFERRLAEVRAQRAAQAKAKAERAASLSKVG